MGVKDLWNILSPLCERKPMFELQGKTVAIDLSCWVVDSQTVTDNHAQPKMYLRNLFFRTAFLLLQGIAPVFVLEGTAPTLKHNTMAKRCDIRNGPRERKTKKKGARSQFNRILKECKEMLMYMGLACVQGHGEAEAMCAYLNEDGLVDGCISQDSDCFLYGAKVVYRNFCTSAQGNRGGSGGAVDEYTIDKIEKSLNIGRNKMIALALLCGCDYDDGIIGVGKEAAMKLFKIVEDEEVLRKIKNWRTDKSLDRKEAELLNPNLCSSCGHIGKVQKHAKSGCLDCGTVTKCNDSFKEKRALILNEIALRKKALLIDDFPNQELIDEFLVRKDPVPSRLDLQWKQPNMSKFIEFMECHVAWLPEYAFEKIFPVVTRWQLLHLPDITVEKRLLISDLFVPESIKKIRNIRCVASYEIVWKNDHTIIEKLKEYATSDKENDDVTENSDILSNLVSIEPQDTVLKCYPELVEAFQSLRNAKAKKRPAKGNPRKKENQSSEQTENNKIRTRQKRDIKKTLTVKNNRKIDEFITGNIQAQLEDSFEKMSITPKRCKQPSESKIDASEKNKLYQNEVKRNTEIKRGPQLNKVLQIEKLNVKLNDTLDKMFNELSPDDFLSDNDCGDVNMSNLIDNICDKRNFHFDVTKHGQKSTLDGNSDPTTTKNVDLVPKEFCAENPESFIKDNMTADKSLDEFDGICESYVPLSQRIWPQAKEKCTEEIGGKRLSFGIENLMDDSVSENIQ